jgi:hypothetical protein
MIVARHFVIDRDGKVRQAHKVGPVIIPSLPEWNKRIGAASR